VAGSGASSIATDSAGDTFVAGNGSSSAPATFGTNTSLTLTGSNFGYVAMLDSSANWKWATKLSDSTVVTSFENQLAVDSSGNVYVTGYFGGTVTIGPDTLTSAGSNDTFVAKLNSSGTILWAMQIGGTGLNEGEGLALDGSGNLYVVGSFSNSVSFGGPTLTSATATDAFLTKITNASADNSNVAPSFAWAQDAGGDNWNNVAVAVDSAGTAYVSAGLYPNEVVDSFNTSSGLLNWSDTRSIVNGNDDGNDSLALYTDSSGNEVLYQAGPYGQGVLALYANGANDTKPGSVDWFENFNVPNASGGWGSYLNMVATDSSGNVYVAGISSLESQQPVGFDPASGAAYLNAPQFVAKLDPSGNFLAVRSAGGSAVAVDASGNIHSLGSPEWQYGSANVYDTGSQDLLAPAGSSLVVTLTTQDKGGVLGRVFADLNNNGQLDPNENGVIPVTINAYDANNNLVTSTTAVTNASVSTLGYPALFGEYDLNDLAPGTYTIRASFPSGWTQTTPSGGAYTVTVTAGQDVDATDFGASIPNHTNTYNDTKVPLSIPKTSKSGTTVNATLAVSDASPILSLSVSTNVTGATSATFTLISPDGISIGITPNATVPVTIPYFGHNVHGTWTLQIHQPANAASGTLNSWSVTVVGETVPQIGSFTASSTSVRSGASLTLTASNITDGNPNTTITQVTFYYLNSSGNEVILGYGTQTSPGVWTLKFTVDLASGTYTLFAQAEDSAGIFSEPFALTLTVK